ncbi:MAG TPA: PH domain-containing protein [Candidatus Binatia bacterium]
MGYIESNLLPDEKIVYKAKLYSIIFWKPCALILLGIVFLIIQPIVAAIVIAIGVFTMISPIIDCATSEFGVTNKRVIIKVGFLRRRTLELLLRHVEAISVDQSVTGRILGFGSITLTGTGGIREVFHNISSPLEFRRQIQGEPS